MYCSKCKKQSPDNFTICAYCGAKLTPDTPEKTELYNKESAKRVSAFNIKSVTASLIVVGVITALVCCAVGIATGSKPDGVAKRFSKAIEEGDSEKYEELYDSFYKDYLKENEYYSEIALNEALCEPLFESIEFYKKTCGDDFKINCTVTNESACGADDISYLNETLKTEYGYYKNCTGLTFLDVSLKVKGSEGEYTSYYKAFSCIKIGGKWYRAPDFCKDVLESRESTSGDKTEGISGGE